MNNEVKEIVSKLIINIDRSSQEIFEVIEKNPGSSENDKTLLHCLDMLAASLEIYRDK